ncbi:MAG: type 4a pilus biogenesis protein PilO [Phycisphaerales bacterium]|jgi:Tfp pilus assembly protein PilO|nr:type 4a pilus biogenesis protein PilO [Phycisphaerales bacterium]
MKPNPRELIFALVLLAIPMAAWHLEFAPRQRRQTELKANITAKQAKLNKLFAKKQLSGAIGNLRTEIAESKEAVAIFRSRLPDEKDIDQIVREVWRLAKSNKLSPTSLRTIPPRKDKQFTSGAGPHGEQPVLIQLEGNFNGLYSFMIDLEAQSRIMRVRQMILKSQDKEHSGLVSATIEFSIFFERKQEGEKWATKI